MSNIKELLEMVIGSLNGLDVWEMEATNYECEYCGNDVDLEHYSKLGEIEKVWDEVIKVGDVKEIKETLEKFLAELG